MFNFLARNPSKKSKMAPKKIKKGAMSILPENVQIIAKIPQSKFEAVNRFEILNNEWLNDSFDIVLFSINQITISHYFDKEHNFLTKNKLIVLIFLQIDTIEKRHSFTQFHDSFHRFCTKW